MNTLSCVPEIKVSMQTDHLMWETGFFRIWCSVEDLWGGQHLVWAHLLAHGGAGTWMNEWKSRAPGHPEFVHKVEIYSGPNPGTLEQSEILISQIHPHGTPPLPGWGHLGSDRVPMLSCPSPCLPTATAAISGAEDFHAHPSTPPWPPKELGICSTLPGQPSQTMPSEIMAELLYALHLPVTALITKTKGFCWSQ